MGRCRVGAAAAAMLLLGGAGGAADAAERLAPSDVPLPRAASDPWRGQGELYRWKGTPGWVAGASVYDAGELIYTDFVYDDTGAGGRAQYPTDWDRYADNTADIAEVRVARRPGATVFRVTLNAYRQRDAVVVGLALGRPGGGVSLPWPHGAGVRGPAGTDVVVSAFGTGTTVASAPAGTPRDGEALGVRQAVDLAANTIEVSVPDTVFRPGPRFTLAVASGLWDPQRSRWLPVSGVPGPQSAGGGLPTDPAVFNAAFRPDEPPLVSSATTSRSNDARQGAVLAAGDLTPFAAQVDTGMLERGASAPLDLAKRSGTMVRIYRSRIDDGEGVTDLSGRPCSEVASCTYRWRSRFVPYVVDVPEAYSGSPVGAIVVSHGYTGSHTNPADVYIPRTAPARAPIGALVIANSGRGWGSLYQRWGEADQLEVLADAARFYRLDRDRLVASGGSMGGIGTWVFAARTPDLIRAAVPIDGWAGWTEAQSLPTTVGSQYAGGLRTFDDLMPNLRQLRVHAESTFTDPVVPPQTALLRNVRPLEAAGGEVVDYICQGTHGTQLRVSNLWVAAIADELRGPPRPLPSRVWYATDAVQQRLSRPLGLDRRQAYWVQRIRAGGDGVVDLTADTLPSTEPARLETLDGAEASPSAGSAPCARFGQRRVGTTAATPANRVRGSLRGVDDALLRLDLARVAPRRRFVLELSSDRRTALRLTDVWSGAVAVRIDGRPAAALARRGGQARLALLRGRHRYVLIPRGR